MRIRISQTLIVNSLCCAIGPLAAWNAWWIITYWPTITSTWGDLLRCVEMASR
jgi:hypothetical protein